MLWVKPPAAGPTHCKRGFSFPSNTGDRSRILVYYKYVYQVHTRESDVAQKPYRIPINMKTHTQPILTQEFKFTLKSLQHNNLL